MHPAGVPVKLTSACTNCRDKKIKCSGGSPCKSCHRQHRTCFYPASRRGKRGKSDAGHLQAHRLSHPMLTALHPPPQPSNISTLPQIRPPGESGFPLTPSNTSPEGQEAQETSPENQYHHQPLTTSISHLLSPIQVQNPTSQYAGVGVPDFTADKDDGAGVGANVEGEEGVLPLHKVNWEHHGPWSWVSVCSRPGVRWVCSRTRTDEFVDIANGLTKTWSRRLKMKRYQPLGHKFPEPPQETAWKYVEAYFDLSYDAVFGIVHRPSFEARLRAHFNSSASIQNDDPSWFALRNIVYAAGCKCLLASNPEVSFADADSHISQYFQNSLSVFSEIIFGHSGFTAVQALAIMTFYAEGLGSPALEYPLCTNAVQLAQAKGLHREPSKYWGLPTSDVLNRSWLWWTIYCLEKQIAFRSGRPSLIDDDNISTPIPTAAPPGSTIDVEVMTLIVKHAQISSQISNRIMSVRAFKQSPAQALDTVHDIHGKLQDLLESIPLDLRVNPTKHGGSGDLPHARRFHSLYLHFALHGSLMATHIIYFYPWISLRFGNRNDDQAFQTQVTNSANSIAHSARQIILTLRSFTTDIAVPAWLAFYYPMYAHINLFVYLLRFPTLATAMGDLALLDMCAGHFGHIEHVTNSDISFHFPRESASLCLKLIKAAVEGPPRRENETMPATPQPGGTSTADSAGKSRTRTDVMDISVVTGEDACPAPGDMAPNDPFAAMDFDMESWNIFSSIDITNDLSTTFETFVDS